MSWQEFHSKYKEWYAQSMFGCAYDQLRDPKTSMVDDEMATHWLNNNLERILKGE